MPERQRQEKLTERMKNDKLVMTKQSLVQLHLENADDAIQGALFCQTDKNSLGYNANKICVMNIAKRILPKRGPSFETKQFE